jgi:alpha-glucosidase
MLGSALMISPVVQAGARKKSTYFPDDKFYDFYTGRLMNPEGETVKNVDAGLDHLPIFARAGFVIPIQKPVGKNYIVSEIRNSPIGLIIALDADNRAAGSIYLDDGESNILIL